MSTHEHFKPSILNLTPHEITIVRESGALPLVLPPSGAIARVTVHTNRDRSVDGCIVVVQTPGAVEGLPAPAPGVSYLVSTLVRLAVPERSDVLSPGDLVRDDRGQVIGCRGLVANAPPVEQSIEIVAIRHECDQPYCGGEVEILSAHREQGAADAAMLAFQPAPPLHKGRAFVISKALR